MEVNGKPVFSFSDAVRHARKASYYAMLDDPDPYGYLDEIQIATGIQLLPDVWHHEPDTDIYNRRLNMRARRQKVAELYLRGLPFGEIAVECQCSMGTVKNDIESINREWRDTYLSDIETLAARDLARLDEMIAKLWRWRPQRPQEGKEVEIQVKHGCEKTPATRSSSP